MKRRTIRLLSLTALFLSSSAMSAQLNYEGNPFTQDLTFKGMVKHNGVKSRPSSSNPIIKGNNIYAPDIIRMGNQWYVYYGGFKNHGQFNDKIYIGVTDDLAFEGPILSNATMIELGSYEHVNDPSVQRRSSTDWVMAYTAAKQIGSDYRDWINISTSSNGLSWSPYFATPSTEVSLDGSAYLTGNQQFTDIARPALLWDGNHWKMWFDGRINNGGAHSYLAISYDNIPSHFTVTHKYPSPGGFPGFFEPDVEKTNNGYVAVIQKGFTDLYKYTSTNGIHFTNAGKMTSKSEVGAQHINNPGLIFDRTNQATYGVAFGMTQNQQLLAHDVGFAYSQYTAQALSCPNVWHGFQDAVFFETVKLKSFQYNVFCMIRIIDSDTGSVLLNKNVSSMDGDQWRFIP